MAREPLDTLFDEAREIVQRGPCFVTFWGGKDYSAGTGPFETVGGGRARTAATRRSIFPGGATFAGLMEPSELGHGSSYPCVAFCLLCVAYMCARTKPTTALEAREALVAAVRCGTRRGHKELLGRLIDRAGEEEVVDLAVAQRAAGPASEAIAPLLSDGPRARLLAQVAADNGSHMSFLGLLLKLGRAFDEAGVTWVVVKGPLLAEMAYRGAPRCYSDLDVVVPAGQFRKALEVVIARGARTIDRNWDLIVRDPRGQLHLAFGPDLGLDLHWHLVNLANQRYRFSIPMEELFDRRRHVQLGPVGAWALDATDSVLHVTLHAALAGGHQLGWLVDIERSVATFGPDWETLVARCHAWHIELPIASLLNRAREVLDAPVPLDVVRELSSGRAGRLLVHSLRKWTPNGRLPGGGSVGRAVTRSLRDGYPATAAELARTTYEMLQRQLDPREFWRDPDDPRNVLYHSGDDDYGLERYLKTVASANRFGNVGARGLG